MSSCEDEFACLVWHLEEPFPLKEVQFGTFCLPPPPPLKTSCTPAENGYEAPDSQVPFKYLKTGIQLICRKMY